MGELSVNFNALKKIKRKINENRNRKILRKASLIIIQKYNSNLCLIIIQKYNSNLCLIREGKKPKVYFYLPTGRWISSNKIFRGGAKLFLNWYSKQ